MVDGLLEADEPCVVEKDKHSGAWAGRVAVTAGAMLRSWRQ